VVTVDDVRALAETLPRSSEVLVHDRVKFRVGQMVYVAFSRDEETMGFGFPKEEREALCAAEPDKLKFTAPLAGRVTVKFWPALTESEVVEHNRLTMVLKASLTCVGTPSDTSVTS